MELRGDIYPHGVTELPKVRFDWKRVYHARAWETSDKSKKWSIVRTWRANTNDDLHNTDEISKTTENYLWSIDGPGHTLPSKNTREKANFRITEANFDEWVELTISDLPPIRVLTGPVVSKRFKWHNVVSSRPQEKEVSVGLGKGWINARDETGRNFIQPGCRKIDEQPVLASKTTNFSVRSMNNDITCNCAGDSGGQPN